MTPGGPVLVVGASGRAAAVTLRKRGFAPYVIDLFGDIDTRLIAESVAVCAPKDYPVGFIDLAKRLPRMPWLYTGGLENHPDVVQAISGHHLPLGCSPEVLRRVRDPFQLGQIVRMPRCNAVRPDDGFRWLRKPLRSAGGQHITFNAEPLRGYYFQEFFAGDSISATFRDATLFGISRQLQGESWLHACDFEYCGNITDAGVTRRVAVGFQQLGDRIASEFGLPGDWGIDAVSNADGLWVLEVNPRYCASVELFEHPDQASEKGKAIYYAPQDLSISDDAPFLNAPIEPRAWTPFADIPAAQTIIRCGEPVVTLRTMDATTAGCIAKLKAMARDLDTFFGDPQ